MLIICHAVNINARVDFCFDQKNLSFNIHNILTLFFDQQQKVTDI